MSSLDPHVPPSPHKLQTYCRSERDIAKKQSTHGWAICSAQAALGIINSLFAPNDGPLLSAPFTCLSCFVPRASVVGDVSRPWSGALVVQYLVGIWLSSCVFRAPIPLAERSPPPLLDHSGGEARPAGVAARGNLPGPPHRFSKFGDYHLIIPINGVVADSTCTFQRNLIIKTAVETHRATAAFSSKEQGSNTQHNNRTNTISASNSPPKYHSCTTQHCPSHPPTNHIVQQYSSKQIDALVRTRTSPEQAGIAERTKYCTRENNSSTSHRHESTHPRTKRPPPTHPLTHPSTDQPVLPPNTKSTMRYSGTAECTATNRSIWSIPGTRFFILKTHWYVESPAKYNKRVSHPFSSIHRPTTHRRTGTGTGTCCCMLKIHVPAIITPTIKTKHPR